MAKVMIGIPDRYIDAAKVLMLMQADSEQEAQKTERAADLYWETETGRNTGSQYWAPKLGLSPSIQNNLFSFRNGYVLPCWSFAALFALLPVIDYDEPQLKHLNAVGRCEAGEYRICYNDQTAHPFIAYGVTMIDAAVDIVEQMVKAGWIFESAKHKED